MSVEERKPKYNQGDVLGYRDLFYVVTRVYRLHYAGYIAGKSNKELNLIKQIDGNEEIKLIARAQ